MKKSDFFARVDRHAVQRAREDLGPCWLWLDACRHDGYGAVYFDGKTERAHRVAFRLEHGRWPVPCALHHCDNRRCVNPAHLFEGDRVANNRDMRAKGRHAKGERHGRSRLSEDAVRAIRASTDTQAEVAARFGVSETIVSQVRTGRRWGHLSEGVTSVGDRLRSRRTAKLTDADVAAIRERLAAGASQAVVAREFHVDQSMVSRINTGDRRRVSTSQR